MKRSALIVTTLPLVAIAYLVYEFAHPPWPPLRVAGLLLLIPAIILLTIARVQLGNSFSLTPQATQLVTRGIYSRIRNPIYFFGTFVFTGLFLFLERPYLLLLLPPVLILQISRARGSARSPSTFRRSVPPIQSAHLVLTPQPGVSWSPQVMQIYYRHAARHPLSFPAISVVRWGSIPEKHRRKRDLRRQMR